MDITKRYNDVVNKVDTKWVDRSTPRRNENATADLLTNKFSDTSSSTQTASTLDELNEIFSSHSTPPRTLFDVTDVLQPISVHSSIPTQSGKTYSIFITTDMVFERLVVSFSESVFSIEPLKPKPLQLIDDISEDLFNKVLSTDERQGSFNK